MWRLLQQNEIRLINLDEIHPLRRPVHPKAGVRLIQSGPQERSDRLAFLRGERPIVPQGSAAQSAIGGDEPRLAMERWRSSTTRSPLTKDFVDIGRCSYYGDTARMKAELLGSLAYPSVAMGKVTLLPLDAARVRTRDPAQAGARVES